MKHLSKLMAVALLFVGFSSIQAQDENNPWQVSFGVNAIDVFPTLLVMSSSTLMTTGIFFRQFHTSAYLDQLVMDFLLEREVL